MKLNDILNNAPELDQIPDEPTVPTEPRRVIFDDTTKPAQTEAPINEIPLPRVMEPMECMQPEPMHKVMIDKAILNAQTSWVKKPIPNAQTPGVKTPKSNPKTNENRERIRKYIASKTVARIPQRNTHLRRTT
jgi:hypothetical protein